MSEMTYQFVLDCSITMAWCFEDEETDFTESILQELKEKTAIVPSIWALEVANVLLLACKHQRINEFESSSFIDIISSLPITIDPSTTIRAMHSIFTLAKESGLTIYDAAYLELALREQIPLLTLDKGLLKAAKKFNVATRI